MERDRTWLRVARRRGAWRWRSRGKFPQGRRRPRRPVDGEDGNSGRFHELKRDGDLLAFGCAVAGEIVQPGTKSAQEHPAGGVWSRRAHGQHIVVVGCLRSWGPHGRMELHAVDLLVSDDEVSGGRLRLQRRRWLDIFVSPWPRTPDRSVCQGFI
jgi:hypothetical protein